MFQELRRHGADPVEGDTSRVDALLLSDSFATTIRPGRVIGSQTPDGHLRSGVDRESIIGADNGALRIPPPLDPGWGREGIAYGPFKRRNGLAFAAFLVNGHNTSHTENLTETMRERLDRWLVGPEVYRRRQRLVQWLRSSRKLRTIRQWRWWKRIAKGAPPVEPMHENLAVGWFLEEAPSDPLRSGNALVMHATGPENGELWGRVGDALLPTIRGVQNLQIYYVVVLREKGAAYYASSVANANGLGPYPALRPLAIDPFGSEPELFAGVHQSTLGQIGFRLDTRVYGTRIAAVDAWGSWFGTAASADSLRGSGTLASSSAQTPGRWEVIGAPFERTSSGARPTPGEGIAVLRAGVPIGLVHCVLECGAAPPIAAIVWRFHDAAHHWRAEFDAHGSSLIRVIGGDEQVVARADSPHLVAGRAHSLQVLDEGHRFAVHLDGALVFGERFEDATLCDADGTGFAVRGTDPDLVVQDFESHPRQCRLPPVLDMGAPWLCTGERIVASEDFDGPERDLDGKPTTTGGQTWKRTIGVGRIKVAGDGSGKIDATSRRPNPGRTAYTIDWHNADFADLEVEITPAGTAKGQDEHGLCGFILWQDDENYVTLNIWRYDSYGGASISTFFQLDGFEDLYDAIWSNVGNGVYWGVPHRLRIVFDGMHYMAFVNDVPVISRALTDVYPDARRMKINRVGLLANWEWGNDTGSSFRHFKARI